MLSDGLTQKPASVSRSTALSLVVLLWASSLDLVVARVVVTVMVEAVEVVVMAVTDTQCKRVQPTRWVRW